MAPKKSKPPFVRFINSYEGDATTLERDDLSLAYHLVQPACTSRWSTGGSPARSSNGEPPKKRQKTANKDSCDQDKCAHRPKCCNHLGQVKWDNKEKALTALRKHAGVEGNPTLELKDPELPIGLKNLGATCFMNSFLQVWYQHPALREGVFACNVDDQELEQSPVYQLQVIFAALQDGASNVYNPKPLVTALKLDSTEQQDAQEFAKLFMNLLDFQLSKQPTPQLRSLISNLFEGKLIYRTTCSRCRRLVEREDNFHEITISLKPGCDLVERTEAALAPEHFNGNDQYYCSHCESKEDAVRTTDLVKLPPVLHFSLMRFVYDPKLGDRKKTNNFITFPRTLDMSPQLDAGETKMAPSMRDNAIYDLQGVLLHKGKSAHHGHYVAQVFDQAHGKWYTFDDESVQELKAKDVSPPAPSLKPAAAAKKGKKSKKPSNRTVVRDEEEDGEDELENKEDPIEISDDEVKVVDDVGPGMIKSGDAYMLIYIRRDSRAAASTTTPEIPPLARKAVDELDADLQRRIETFNETDAKLSKRFEDDRAKKEALWRLLDTAEADEQCFFVSKKQLEAWISDGLAPPLSPKALSKTTSKVIDVDADSDKENSAPVNLETNGETNDHVEEKPEERVEEKADKVEKEDFICRHGKLKPDKLDQVKVISSIAVMMLRDEAGVQFDPQLDVVDALCIDCVASALRERDYVKDHADAVKRYKAAAKGSHNSGVWISRAWLEEWTRLKPPSSLHDAESSTDEPPDAPRWIGDVVCEHGNLQPAYSKRHRLSDAALSVLRQVFPAMRTPFRWHEKDCPLCPRVSGSEQASVEASNEEKRDLSTLLQAPSRPLLTSTMYYALPQVWWCDWKDWIKRPNHMPRPEIIDYSSIICQHGHLLLDLTIPDELRQIVLAMEEEWEIVSSRYPDAYSVIVHVDRSLQPQAEAGTCHSCRDELRLDYEEAKISIRWLEKSDFDSRGNLQHDRERDADADDVPRRSTYGSRSARASTRSRARTETSAGSVKVGPLDTLKDLKLTIMQDLNVATIYQRLFHKGIELEDYASTMRTLEIGPGDTIEVYEMPHNDNAIDLSDLKDVDSGCRPAGARMKKRAAAEAGFAGTGLHGLDIRPSVSRDASEVESEQGGDAAPRAVDGKSCSACTFLNDADAESCTVCETAFL